MIRGAEYRKAETEFSFVSLHPRFRSDKFKPWMNANRRE